MKQTQTVSNRLAYLQSLPIDQLLVYCRRGLQGYDTNCKPAAMIEPGTWLRVISTYEAPSVLLGEICRFYDMALTSGQSPTSIRYKPITRTLWEATDLWEVYAEDEVAIAGPRGLTDLLGDDDALVIVDAALTDWWDSPPQLTTILLV
jgi:hypothetical protein